VGSLCARQQARVPAGDPLVQLLVQERELLALDRDRPVHEAFKSPA
jgi:hypothetical protein